VNNMKENNDIKYAIDILRTNDFYGGGDNIEIAKGKYQMISNWNDAKTKIKRILKSKK